MCLGEALFNYLERKYRQGDIKGVLIKDIEAEICFLCARTIGSF